MKLFKDRVKERSRNSAEYSGLIMELAEVLDKKDTPAL